MYKINILNNNAKQEFQWIIPNLDKKVKLFFEYRDNQLGWFISISYDDYIYENIRLTTTENLLRSYSSYLPFGLRCTTTDNLEPMSIDDFSTGYTTIYMLDSATCKDIEEQYYAQISI